MLKCKRIYDPPEATDGYRVLVDRLWPRGLTKERAKIDEWMKDLAPSDTLRRWFSHDPKKWDEFKKRYREELKNPTKAALLAQIRELSRRQTVTILYSARDEKHNNAVVVREMIKER